MAGFTTVGPSVERGVDTTFNEKFDYTYPFGEDLSPTSTLHQTILQKILSRARDSRNRMQGRYNSWRNIDRTLTAFIPLSEEERLVKEEDTRKPVAVVVPYSYAAMESLVSQMVSTFLSNEFILRYQGVGPEDVVGALLMQHLIQLQFIRSSGELGLITQWRDGFAYGSGVLAPVWDIEVNDREEMLWEGHRLDNIDMYNFLPDPNTPMHRVQESEFVGWMIGENRMNLLTRERLQSEGLFNVRYLSDSKARSSFSMDGYSGREDRSGGEFEPTRRDTTNPIDVIYMYINLVPKEWKIGDSEYPQKWMFAVANDSVLIKAQPLNLEHNRFPVVVNSPDFDGYSVAPLSRMEVVYPLQELGDWLVNTHVANIRKSLNDMFIVDPFRVNMNDLLKPGPGKIIRMRRPAWGSGVSDAITQLKVEDVTARHIPDTIFVSDLIERALGAPASIQGVADNNAPERRTAFEVRSTQSGTLGRLAKAARIMSAQSMRGLGYMMASQTSQLMSEDTWVKLIGDKSTQLINEYGLQERIQSGRVRVRPDEINVNYDVMPVDSTMTSGESPDLWLQLYQIIGNNPALMQGMDITRVFLHIARAMGANNPEEFMLKEAPQVDVQVRPDEEVLAEEDAGNLVAV